MDKFPPEAATALQSGRLIEAIKIVRDATGMDLQSARAAVERYANQPAKGANWQENDWGRDASTPPAGVPAAALAALARGNKMEAVRLTREATGLGLAAAKDLVEEDPGPGAADFGHVSHPVSADPTAEPGRVTGGTSRGLLIVMVLLIAALVWAYLEKRI